MKKLNKKIEDIIKREKRDAIIGYILGTICIVVNIVEKDKVGIIIGLLCCAVATWCLSDYLKLKRKHGNNK